MSVELKLQILNRWQPKLQIIQVTVLQTSLFESLDVIGISESSRGSGIKASSEHSPVTDECLSGSISAEIYMNRWWR